MCLDHQLRTVGLSLERFVLSEADKSTRPSKDWPLLSWCWDQGPPEPCATVFLEFKLKAMWGVFPDVLHGSWRDAELAISRAGHAAHRNLYLVAKNLPHGPRCEDIRYGQVKKHVGDFIDNTPDPSATPLRMDVVQRMPWEQQDPGLQGDSDLASTVLLRMKDSCLAQKGFKSNMNRFMSTVKASLPDAANWYFRC